MAFLSKVGNILRQTASRKFSSEQGFTPSIYYSARCMSSASSSKLFLGGLSFSTDEPSLRQELAKYGEIVDARIIHDRETGRSRGFGFVTFTSVEEASSAIQALDGKELHGRLVRVNYATDRPRTFGGGYNNAQYGGGGGFSGGYGNAPYGAGGGVSYGDGGAYGSGAGGGYGGHAGPTAGGNHASGGDYNANNYGGNSYGIGGTAGSYGGSGSSYGNDGGFGGAGGSDNLGNAGGFGVGGSGSSYGNDGGFGGAGGSENLGNAGGFGVSDNYGNDRSTGVGHDASGTGAGNNFATGGYDGNNGPEYDINQFGSNLNHAGDDADSFQRERQFCR